MTHTQTLTLPEFTRCEFLPAVFGAGSSSVTSGVSRSLPSTSTGAAAGSSDAAPAVTPKSATETGSPSNPLPPGVVLWGPSSGGFWEFRSESDKWYFWQGMWLENLSPTQGSFEYRNEAIAFPPTCPPPDHPAPQPATKPLPDGGIPPGPNALLQQAEAWRAVAAELDKCFPKWNKWDGRCARECAVAQIKECFLTIEAAKVRTNVVAEYSKPLPAPDGTVDAWFVAENAGEYSREGTVDRYLSDGNGRVRYRTPTGDDLVEWGGVSCHMSAPVSRFRPLFTPLPPSPAKEEEPVNPYKAGDWCVTGWEQAADAWRAYHADRTNQLVIDHARLTDSLRARLAAAEKVVDMSRAYIAAWSRPMVMGFHTWNEDHEAARKALADAVNPLSGGGAA